MSSIRQWIICIIFSSLICAVVSVLSPNSSIKKAMQTVISVFLLSAFVLPFLSKDSIEIDFSLSDYSNHQSSLSDCITETMLEQAENQAVIKTEELLASLKISDFSVSAEAATDSDNNIYIKTVFIGLSSEYLHREKQITSNIESMFGSEVEYKWEKK